MREHFYTSIPTVVELRADRNHVPVLVPAPGRRRGGATPAAPRGRASERSRSPAADSRVPAIHPVAPKTELRTCPSQRPVTKPRQIG